MEFSAQQARAHRNRRIAIILAGGAAAIALTGWATTWPAARWEELAVAAGWLAGQVRSLGAGWFFAAFAVLPAVGTPVSIFALSAGPLFGPALGMPTVLGLAGLSMAVSMTISYALARWALRPWVVKLLGYLGYRAPMVPPDKARMFTLLVRVTPGPPYVLQSFLLGLSGVRYGTYLLISWPVSTLNVSLFILFGDALAQGRGRVAMLALAGLVVAAVAVKLARGRLARRAERDLAGAVGTGEETA